MLNLEAIMVPTGPRKEIDGQRALAGANYFLERRGEPGDRYVLISGEYNQGIFLGSQTEGIQKAILGRGVPLEFIEHESLSKNTRENVVYSSRIFKENGTDGIQIASDWLHAARIKMLFQRAKKKEIVPIELKIGLLTDEINLAYSVPKSLVAYLKDLVLPLK